MRLAIGGAVSGVRCGVQAVLVRILRGAVDHPEGCKVTTLADIGSGLNGVECTVSASSGAITSSQRCSFAGSAAIAVAVVPCGNTADVDQTLAVDNGSVEVTQTGCQSGHGHITRGLYMHIYSQNRGCFCLCAPSCQLRMQI